MITVLWLIVWLIAETPTVSFQPTNDWAIGLIVCIVLDLISAFGSKSWDD